MEKVKKRQRLLSFLQGNDGRFYYDGPIDGIDGPGTQAGAQRFLEDYGFADAVTFKSASVWDGIKYFGDKECRCHCNGKFCDGTKEPERELLEVADEIREEIGAPLIPTSVIRCEEWNKICGGVTNSRHKLGKAMDAYSPSLTAAQLLTVAQKNPRVRYAYAVDDKVVHFDVE